MADKEFRVKISAETDDFSRGMDRAEDEASGLGDTLKSDVTRGAESATESLKETVEELRRLQREAIGAKTSVGGMGNTFGSTSGESNKFNREMQRLSMVLGGDVPESTKEAYREMMKLHKEARTAQRLYGKYSQEALNARDAINTFALGLDDTTFKQIYMRSQLGLTDMQLRQQANSIKLNARMTKLMGNQTQILIQRMQGLAKHGIKPEMLLPPSTIGQFQLLNETMAAGQAPISRLSELYRKFGTSMDKTIKGWSAQKMAIKAAQGDMVKYGLLMRGITAGLGSMTMALPLVGMGAFFAYKTMFKSALEADGALKKLAETTQGKVAKAFEPVIQAAGKFLEIAFKVTGVVADWITKFNETHPIIAKVAGAIGFLLPAMTLLLLPLGLGLGLFNGWKLVLGAVWPLISGVVGLIGTASATFLTFAAVIGAVAAAFMHLWKTNKNFKNGVTKIWDFIKVKAQDVFGSLVTIFTKTLPEAYAQGGIQGVFEKVNEAIKNALNNMSTIIPQFITKGIEIITNLLLGLTEAMPQVFAKSTEIVTNLTNGIVQMLPTFINTGITIIQAWANSIATNLPIILNTGITILMALIDGILSVLPVLIDTAMGLLTTILDVIVQSLPIIIEGGAQILTAVVDGIVNALPKLIDAAIQIINAISENLTANLPKIIDSAIKIMETLIRTIINNLPQIIECALKIILAIVDGIANNLPKIIEAAGKIITALAEALITNLPQILSAIVEIMLAIGKGIIEGIPGVVKAMGNVIKDMAKATKDAIPGFLSIGKDIIKGLAKGIKNGLSSAVNAVKDVVKAAIDKGKALLGINSPSKLFMQFGEWTTEGYQIGVDRGEPKSTRAVENFANNSIEAFSTNALPQEGSLNNSSVDNSTYNININAGALNNEQDLYKLAEIIDRKLLEIKQRNSKMFGGYQHV
ncbi:hypothetical protein [Paraclostridium tenue]|uniref:PUL domain-containing protein n=1 Tax=Paraclostridium tenue TaxID=1737 RepID=A0ABN1LXW8_9FIRM